MHNEYWSEWMGISMFIWIVLLLLIVFGLFYALSSRERITRTPKQSLEERYAKGEITKDEFEKTLRALER
jgi:putative membrane protein